MIQTLEDMIKGFCACGLEFKDSDGFTHDWCTLIPALKLAYKTPVHSSTGQTPAIFKIILDKVTHHAKQSKNDAFDYAKQEWDKSHKVPELKVRDLVLASPLNFNNIKGPKKLKDSHLGPFVIFSLHGTNAVQVELSGELENKHPTFPVSLIKPYQPTDKELLSSRNPTPLTVSPVEQSKEKRIRKVIKKRRLWGKNKREYLFRYRNPVHDDELLEESEIPNSDKLLRRFRHERRPQA
ncbi:hypothetical protein O181_090865 [Austropuccinia psidii MF-1]|uniref:Tf2-1-like SH3-like domain-containing protein n=1 Tax=Austropuccinia psidii MF-1 TaxID=1389203 RepID=A0A9Q3P7H9_9BASI|nr:hypothetical protein [Austropuccinia psidii MF-1]